VDIFANLGDSFIAGGSFLPFANDLPHPLPKLRASGRMRRVNRPNTRRHPAPIIISSNHSSQDLSHPRMKMPKSTLLNSQAFLSSELIQNAVVQQGSLEGSHISTLDYYQCEVPVLS